MDEHISENSQTSKEPGTKKILPQELSNISSYMYMCRKQTILTNG